MRVLRILLEKEFRQIFRNPAILRLIFIMPTIQLLVLPLAADYEVKDINIAIVDQDHSSYSRQLTNKISASTYFNLVEYTNSYDEAIRGIEKDEADVILQIPASFEKDLVKEDKAQLFMALNAINGVKANLGGVYLRSIINDFNGQVRLEWIQLPRFNPQPIIQVSIFHGAGYPGYPCYHGGFFSCCAEYC